MFMIIMIYHIFFSISIKETLLKFRRLSPGSALQVIYFCQYSSERGTFCFCDTRWRFTKSERPPVKHDYKLKTYLNTHTGPHERWKEEENCETKSWIAQNFNIVTFHEVQSWKFGFDQNKKVPGNFLKTDFNILFNIG